MRENPSQYVFHYAKWQQRSLNNGLLSLSCSHISISVVVELLGLPKSCPNACIQIDLITGNFTGKKRSHSSEDYEFGVFLWVEHC